MERKSCFSWLFFSSICSLHQSLPEHTIPLDIRMRNGQSVEFLITHEKSICIINPLLLLRALQLSPLVHRAELNTIQCSNRKSREWDAPYIKWAWNAAILREALRWGGGGGESWVLQSADMHSSQSWKWKSHIWQFLSFFVLCKYFGAVKPCQIDPLGLWTCFWFKKLKAKRF